MRLPWLLLAACGTSGPPTATFHGVTITLPDGAHQIDDSEDQHGWQLPPDGKVILTIDDHNEARPGTCPDLLASMQARQGGEWRLAGGVTALDTRIYGSRSVMWCRGDWIFSITMKPDDVAGADAAFDAVVDSVRF